jgi:hypothetical protein
MAHVRRKAMIGNSRVVARRGLCYVSALLVILLGLAPYLFARRRTPAEYLGWRPVTFGIPFERLTGSVPSFAHAFAFVLILCYLVGPSLRRVRVCAICWTGVEVFFELLQQPAAAHVLRTSARVPDTAIAGLIAAITRGTYDALDLIAVFLGSAIAYGLCVGASFDLSDRHSHERRIDVSLRPGVSI